LGSLVPIHLLVDDLEGELVFDVGAVDAAGEPAGAGGFEV
jgi:hypothetical protein